MGAVDRIWFKFTCPKCGKSDIETATDSGRDRQNWGTISSGEFFTVASTGGRRDEPDVTSAECKDCKVPAKIESKYGMARPAGF